MPKLPDSMPWEIHQADLSRPNAVLHLFEKVFGTTTLYGPPAPDLQQRSLEAQESDKLKAQVAKLKEEVGDLHYRNFQLQRRNAELEAQLSKDSHNSSRPPSTDPPWGKRTKSLRRPSGKRPGGQLGHPGHTRPLAACPSRVIVHGPPQSTRFFLVSFFKSDKRSE